MNTLKQLLSLSSITIKKGLNIRNKLTYNLYHHDNLIGSYQNKKEINLQAVFLLDSLTTKIL